MTDKQRIIYNYIVAYYDQHGAPPSNKEMMEVYGTEKHQRITQIVNALLERGFLKRRKKDNILVPTKLKHETQPHPL